MTDEEIEIIERKTPIVEQILSDSKPARKVRRDKGIPKGPKTAPAIGVLSAMQASRLNDLIQTQECCRVELESAEASVEFRQGRLDAARQELYDYLLELQGKKTG